MKFKLKRNLSAGGNAGLYYDKAKKLDKKIGKIKKEIEETKKRLKKAEKEEIKLPERKEKKIRERKWYEKFRWFFSSEGILCIGGRDATTNEMVVGRHSNDKSVILHASFSGSPFVVIQENDPGKKTIEEAAIFCASNSRAWKEGLRTAKVYWVMGEQVTKEAPAGEYLGKGAFMIYGKKNFMEVPLKIAIGLEGERIIGGPESAVKEKTENYVIILPGHEKTSDVAKKIKKMLQTKLPLEDIQSFIPPGDAEIAES